MLFFGSQVVVSLGAGPWDAIFGGGNEPAFLAGSVFAAAAAVMAFFKLPHIQVHRDTAFEVVHTG